ncbi:MAG: hypothetical protein KAW67_04175, partial [Candidatus Eisenbacteria sp.]|nr:hypothetical protein [Candidatus Eisenbacteria bacterium]
KEGSNALGAFVVRDELTNLVLPGSQWSRSEQLEEPVTGAVVRYRMDLASASTVGLILTNRESNDYYNRVGGVDGNLRLTPSDRLSFQVLCSKTDYADAFADSMGQPDGEFDGMAYDVEYNHDSGSFDWWLAYREIEEEFRADMGFSPQSGFRQGRTGWSHTWRAEAGHWYTALNSGFGYVHKEERDGDPLESSFDGWLNYSGPMRSSVDLYGVWGTRNFYGEDYDNRYVRASASLWPTGSTWVRLQSTVGDAIDVVHGREADRVYLDGLVNFKVAKRLDVLVEQEYERLDVPNGRLYSANITYLRTAYQFTRRASLRAILQHVDYGFNSDLYWNGRSRRSHFASQVLFSYKLNPQTVLYAGYSDNHLGNDDTNLTQNDRTFFAKIGYAWVL